MTTAAACCSYGPGHVTHWIAVLRVYGTAPRDAITLVKADDDGPRQSVSDRPARGGELIGVDVL